MVFFNLITSCLKAAFSVDNKSVGNKQKKRSGPLGDDYDFREEFSDTVEKWEALVDELSDYEDEYDGTIAPKEYKKGFDEKYKATLEYLKNTVKPFLSEHSEGYRKSDLNIIYKDLVELANEHKQDFLENGYHRIIEDYKEFLEEQEEEKRAAAEWAAFTQEVTDKLKTCQPIKQKAFIDSFEDKSDVRAALNELVENDIVTREKKGGAYFISFAAPHKMRMKLLNTLNNIKTTKNV